MAFKFQVVKLSAAGNLLLKSADAIAPAVSKQIDVFVEGKRAATVFETIGLEKDPYYLARPVKKEEAARLVGKEMCTLK